MKELGGEEVVVTVPVGIQMLKADDTEEGSPDMIEATLSDIEKNKMITLWLNDSVSDRAVAEFVMIMR